MAAYAAVVSLMHILDLIKNHPSPPISFDKQHLDSLTEIVTFLQEFLEGYVSPFSYSDEPDPLEMRIAEAVYAAEDEIETYIVDSIEYAAGTYGEEINHDDDDDDYECDDGHDGDAMESYTVDNIQVAAVEAQHEDEQYFYFYFYEGLQNAIEAMSLIKKEVEMEMEMEMVKEKGGLLPEAGSKPSSTERNVPMVGFDDVRIELLDRLAGGDSNRQIIPIVGMGGIGKTFLAHNVFVDELIKDHFDVHLWATISQECNIEHALSELLSRGRGNSSVAELGHDLHKDLWGKRYLVVIDDLWSIEVWDKIRNFFPDCGKGSRVLVTSRMSNLAAHLTNPDNILRMSFLNDSDSWTLFSKAIFGSIVPDLEPELREVGEKIVGKCKGLPLSIVVIGGLLAKSERTRGYWEHIEENLSSIVNLENEEYCLRVLKLSYNHLPAHLKPCFLYMGMFDEDSVIEVSTIIRLWVSEGFVKPKEGKNSERVAREYLQELVGRNLVLAHELDSRNDYVAAVSELGWVGMPKLCKIHDLVRDLSLREAQKQRFYYVYSKQNPSNDGHRRIVFPDKSRGIRDPPIMLESTPYVRSYVSHDDYVGLFPGFRLLRTLHTTCREHSSIYHEYSQKAAFRLVNSRLLEIAVREDRKRNDVLHTSICRLWSLHTLLVHSESDLKGPVQIWNMHQLRHIEFTKGRLSLQRPDNNDNNVVILENLHTLIGMDDFHLNEDVAMRMPNLTILDVRYGLKMDREVHSPSYLQRLTKLESFRCSVNGIGGEDLQGICFPPSLKQITLLDDMYSSHIEVEGILLKIGWLPFVEELVIEGGFFEKGEWETLEGQFPRLRTLHLIDCNGLRKWMVSETVTPHFPLLEELLLDGLRILEEIPSEIGELGALKSFVVSYCSKSTVLSAKNIVEEQEEFDGEDGLSFRVIIKDAQGEYGSLATPNFKVELYG